MEKQYDGRTSRQKKIRIAIASVVGLIAALLVFQAGIVVGYHKALFSYHDGARYFNMMEEPQNGSNMMLGAKTGVPPIDFGPSHGAVGKVVSVSLPSFVVASPDNREETVVVGDDTSVRIFRQTASTTDIHVGELVLVLGEPDDSGNIQARLIRLVPQLSQGAGAPSAPSTASSSASSAAPVKK